MNRFITRLRVFNAARRVARRAALCVVLLVLPLAALGRAAGPQGTSDGPVVGFDGTAKGTYMSLETEIGTFTGPDRVLRVVQRLDSEPGQHALRLGAVRDGQKRPTIEVQLDLASEAVEGSVLSMDMLRSARRKWFKIELETRGGPSAGEMRDVTKELSLTEFRRIDLVLPAGTTGVSFHLTAPHTIGLDLDNLHVRSPRPMEVLGTEAQYVTQPVTLPWGGQAAESALAKLQVRTSGVLQVKTLKAVRLKASVEGAEVERWRLMGADGKVLAEAQGPFEGGWAKLEPMVPLLHGDNDYVLMASVANRKPSRGSSAPVESSPEDSAGKGAPKKPLLGPDRTGLAGAPISLQIYVLVDGEAEREAACGGTAPRTARVLDVEDLEVLETALLPVRASGAAPSHLVGAVTLQTDRGPRIRFLGPDADGHLAPASWLTEGVAADWNTYAPTLLLERPSGAVHAFFMVARPDAQDRPEIWRTKSPGGDLDWEPAQRLEWALQPKVAPPEQGPALLGGRGIQTAQGPWALLVQAPGKFSHRLLISKNSGSSFLLGPPSEIPAEGGVVVEIGAGGLLVDSFRPRTGKRYLAVSNSVTRAWSDSISKRRTLLQCAGKGSALIHVARDLSGSQDWRLIFANVPGTHGGTPAGLVIRGSNDSGDNWPDDLAVLLDEGKRADHPALAMRGKNTVAILYASGRGELCVQYLELPAVVKKAVSFYEAFGPGSGLGR